MIGMCNEDRRKIYSYRKAFLLLYHTICMFVHNLDLKRYPPGKLWMWSRNSKMKTKIYFSRKCSSTKIECIQKRSIVLLYTFYRPMTLLNFNIFANNWFWLAGLTYWVKNRSFHTCFFDSLILFNKKNHRVSNSVPSVSEWSKWSILWGFF